MRAVEMMEKWTGVEKEVLYLYFSKGGYLTLDPTIKPAWVDALKLDHGVLAKEKPIPALDFDDWITESYVKTAYKELGVDYEAEKAKIVDPVKANAGLPMEIWHARDGIKTLSDHGGVPEGGGRIQRRPARKLNATYVYDRKPDSSCSARPHSMCKAATASSATFLRKREAEAYAKKVGGDVITYEQAWGSFAS